MAEGFDYIEQNQFLDEFDPIAEEDPKQNYSAKGSKRSHHSSIVQEEAQIATRKPSQVEDDGKGRYGGEEEEIYCGRFPHMDLCACDIQCSIALRDINLFEVYNGIFMGPYQSSFKTKQLIEAGVTHILNASCREYTKRHKYFKYLDVQIYDAHTENAKNHFRITNRFIEEGRREGKY